jgi:hypothetical protein
MSSVCREGVVWYVQYKDDALGRFRIAGPFSRREDARAFARRTFPLIESVDTEEGEIRIGWRSMPGIGDLACLLVSSVLPARVHQGGIQFFESPVGALRFTRMRIESGHLIEESGTVGSVKPPEFSIEQTAQWS